MAHGRWYRVLARATNGVGLVGDWCPTPWLLVVTNERVQDVRMLSGTAHNVASHRRQ